jgi:hypothetical protein
VLDVLAVAVIMQIADVCCFSDTSFLVTYITFDGVMQWFSSADVTAVATVSGNKKAHQYQSKGRIGCVID